MMMIDGMRSQLLGELTSKGFVKSLEHASSKSSRMDIVRCVLACGFYPNVGKIAGNPRNDAKSKSAMMTPKGERVRIHPSSVNSNLRNEVDQDNELGRNSLIFYDELTRGDSIMCTCL